MAATPEERQAQLDAAQAQLNAEIAAQHQPTVAEIADILNNEDVKTAIARLDELGRTLPSTTPYANLRMMAYSTAQAFGGAANALREAQK